MQGISGGFGFRFFFHSPFRACPSHSRPGKKIALRDSKLIAPLHDNGAYERISPSAFPKFITMPTAMVRLRPGSISLTFPSVDVATHLSCDRFLSPQILWFAGCRTTSATGCAKSYNLCSSKCSCLIVHQWRSVYWLEWISPFAWLLPSCLR